LFRALPELELSPKFDIKSAYRMIQRIPTAEMRMLVTRAFEVLISRTHGLKTRNPPGGVKKPSDPRAHQTAK
jgi:hypothetical protein